MAFWSSVQVSSQRRKHVNITIEMISIFQSDESHKKFHVVESIQWHPSYAQEMTIALIYQNSLGKNCE